MEAVHIEEGNTEGRGALVLMVVGDIDADEQARTPHLMEQREAPLSWRSSNLIGNLERKISTSSESQVGNSTTNHLFRQACGFLGQKKGEPQVFGGEAPSPKDWSEQDDVLEKWQTFLTIRPGLAHLIWR